MEIVYTKDKFRSCVDFHNGICFLKADSGIGREWMAAYGQTCFDIQYSVKSSRFFDRIAISIAILDSAIFMNCKNTVTKSILLYRNGDRRILPSFSRCLIILHIRTPVHKIDMNAGFDSVNAKFPQGSTLRELFL